MKRILLPIIAIIITVSTTGCMHRIEAKKRLKRQNHLHQTSKHQYRGTGREDYFCRRFAEYRHQKREKVDISLDNSRNSSLQVEPQEFVPMASVTHHVTKHNRRFIIPMLLVCSLLLLNTQQAEAFLSLPQIQAKQHKEDNYHQKALAALQAKWKQEAQESQRVQQQRMKQETERRQKEAAAAWQAKRQHEMEQEKQRLHEHYMKQEAERRQAAAAWALSHPNVHDYSGAPFDLFKRQGKKDGYVSSLRRIPANGFYV